MTSLIKWEDQPQDKLIIRKNKYMASDCPLAGKHLNQLSKDTEIRHDEALHPIEIMAKAYKL
jgi:glycerol-3-phosphate dehydrogenase subunit C